MTQCNDGTEFEIPEDIQAAVRLHRSIRTDIQDIQDQLTEAKGKEDVDPSWLKSAKHAFRKKQEHRAALADHIQKHNDRAKAIRDAQANFSIIPHLRYHNKLMGRLNNLLFLVEEFIAKDDDETYQAMVEAVSEIRQMDASAMHK